MKAKEKYICSYFKKIANIPLSIAGIDIYNDADVLDTFK